MDRLIGGAIFNGTQPRIVRIDDFMLEAIPEGATILIQNHDQPGVVGMVGTSRACAAAKAPSETREMLGAQSR